MLLLGLALLILGPVSVAQDPDTALRVVGGVVVAVVGLLLICGLYSLQPNEGMAILLFGDYRGTDRKTGLRWVLPWYSRKKVSLRVRNLTSDKLKVNDKRGSPIEIAANVVWRVEDSALALFDVDDYQAFVNIQVDTALRDIASHYAYDHGDETDEPEMTLRADAEDVAGRLRDELVGRVSVAGVAIDEARLAHLAYAPEIAGAMLQASAGRGRPVGPPPDRQRRGRHGRERPGRSQRTGRGRAGRGPQGRHGVQPAGRSVRRSRGPTGRQHRHPVRLTHGPGA